MDQTRNQSKIFVYLLILFITVIILSQRPHPPAHEFNEVWEVEPEISAHARSNLWFQKNKEGPIYPGPHIVSMNINYLLQDDEINIVDQIFVNKAIDLYNNSIYVAVSDTRPKVLTEFKETIKLPSSTSIHFIKAPAPLQKLKEWEESLWNSRDELNENGVRILESEITINGTIQLGIIDITDETSTSLLDVLEGIVPPGILSLYNLQSVKITPSSSSHSNMTGVGHLIGFHGYLGQKLHPEVEHIDGEPGLFTVTLEVFDPEIGFTGEHLYLLNETGGYYLMGVNTKPLPEDFFMFFGPRMIQVIGVLSNRTSLEGKNFSLLQVFDITYSEIGSWYKGNLSTMNCNLRPYTLLNRQYDGFNHTYLSFRLLDENGTLIEEMLLASHEGYIYDVPYCATLQPIAKANTGDTIMIYGLLTQLTEENGDSQKVLMIYQVKNLSKTPARPH